MLTKQQRIKRMKRINSRLRILQWFFNFILTFFLVLNIAKAKWGWAIFDFAFIVLGLHNIRSIDRDKKIIEEIDKMEC